MNSAVRTAGLSYCRKHASARFSPPVAEGEARVRCFCTSSAVDCERTAPNASDGSIHRYYDPATGQFLSVDPAVESTQQRYQYSQDDPVNVVDPNGVAPYSYTYDYTYDLGLNNVAPSTLATWLRDNCSWVFPLSGCSPRLQAGQKLNLQMSVLFSTQSFPARVVHIGSSSFTFVALAGHPEGAGRTITFGFGYGKDCTDQLTVSTSSNGSLWTKPPLDLLNFPLAHAEWQILANDIGYGYTEHPNWGNNPWGEV